MPETDVERRAREAFLAGDPIELADSESIRGERVANWCKAAWRSGPNASLIVRGGRIEGDLVLDYVRTDASIDLRNVKTGVLRLRRTTLYRLILTGCVVQRIEAAGLKAGGSVDLNGGFRSNERVRLVGAVIEGSLDAPGAEFGRSPEDRVKKKSALVLDGARVEGNVVLRDVKATGPIRGRKLRVGGSLRCSGVMTELDMRGADVGGDGNFFKCDIAGDADLRDSNFAGSVSLHWSKIGTEMHMQRCAIGGTLKLGVVTVGGPSVSLSAASVGRSLAVREIRPAGTGGLTIRLLGLSVGRLEDERGSWPARQADSLHLDGLSIGSMDVDGPRVDERIEWLMRNARWSPQPWRELGSVLLRAGHAKDAQRLAIERENERTRRSDLPWLARAGREVLRVTIGYGYRPMYTLRWACGIVAVAAVAFVWADFRSKSGAPESSTILYSLDAFVPVDLGYFGAWTPTDAGWSAVAVFEAASGWLLGALLLGAATGLLKKD